MKTGDNIIKKKEVIDYNYELMEIPYGNDFHVKPTKIEVIHVNTINRKYVIYNTYEDGSVVDNMIACALQAKQSFAMGQSIQGGLEIFQRFYDKHYVNATWIGIQGDIIEYLESILK